MHLLNESLLKSLESMPAEFLVYALDALPVEFTIIDAEDNVRFWNRHGVRVFKRGPGVIGRNVRMCHPKHSVDRVEKVIDLLRSGKEDHVDFWIDLPEGDRPRKLLIRYFAIRDDNGKYLGVLEASLNLTPLQKITGERRLDDLE